MIKVINKKTGEEKILSPKEKLSFYEFREKVISLVREKDGEFHLDSHIEREIEDHFKRDDLHGAVQTLSMNGDYWRGGFF